jgi:hypothetical protein
MMPAVLWQGLGRRRSSALSVRAYRTGPRLASIAIAFTINRCRFDDVTVFSLLLRTPDGEHQLSHRKGWWS